jgi:bacillolysin
MQSPSALQLLGLFAALSGVATQTVACGGEHGGADSAPVADASPAQMVALDSLRARTHSHWTFTQHQSFKTPAHLEGKLSGALAGRAPLAATLGFLEENRTLFRMNSPSTEFRMARERKDSLAMTHVRLQQMIRGVRVLGGELSAHYDKTGALRVVDANYIAGLEALNINPSIDSGAASQAALTHALTVSVLSAGAACEAPELVVYVPQDGGEAKLAYTLMLRDDSEEHYARRVYQIDANSGAVLNTYDNLQTVEATGQTSLGASKKFEVTMEGGQYVMKDGTRGNGIWTYTAGYQQTLPGQIVKSSSLTSWDQVQSGRGAAVDAHVYASKVYDYYKTVHARMGLDGNNTRMVSTVHFGQNYQNAFFDGTQMAYGDGDGTPFTASLDVVGHEFTHGVVSAESNLVYQNQSGALNEAIADILGSAIENDAAPNTTRNWQLGEDLGFVIRNMAAPKTANQPDHQSGYVNTNQDNGGVHINSGIINNAAYLMTVGGTNSTSKKQVAKGLGWTKMAKLFYRANEQYLMSGSNFAALVTASKSAATDLQFTENEKRIVNCAFVAVGLSNSTCETLTTEPVPVPDAGKPTVDAGTPEEPGDPGDGTPSDGTPDDANAEPVKNGAQADEGLSVDSGGCSTTGTSRGAGGAFGFIAAALVLSSMRRRRS